MQPDQRAQLYIASISLLAVLIALVSQHVYDMQPCAWCVAQRMLYLLIAAVGFLGSLGQAQRTKLALCFALILSIALAGITAAIYQAQVASQSFSCAQSLADQWMTKTGLESAVPWLFGIYASCMDARITLLGIEYAYWSLTLFALIALASVYRLSCLLRRNPY
ncbi:disulfide bond formation protein B [Alcaligenaceae bacterium LF4-65]|jgi:disulfide bond formation protein DsbB|uniref:Disulfide bond formation protein B n=1 Tax=Zwartia hollandica TaxID=324606 RepID=A0A953T3B9_9BURK|nr:disulfide bond formation protein B [Zwartia hollandica]MBZ1349221.1 disulfide bond formation protein B [Zwartia hollandica]